VGNVEELEKLKCQTVMWLIAHALPVAAARKKQKHHYHQRLALSAEMENA
jgi:hypothetical protein